jgi:N-acetylglucosamine transport system permease protein
MKNLKYLSRHPFQLLIFLSLAGWLVLVALPLLWLVYSSFKTNQEIFANPWGLPSGLALDNYVRAWRQGSVGRYFFNSLFIVGASLGASLFICSMAAYGLARVRVRGSRIFYLFFILGMISPTALAMAPLFQLMRSLSLLNTFTGLSLVYTAFSVSFSILVLYSFFVTLPEAMREAAIVDGANEWQVFWHVYLPLAKPGLVTVAIFNFLGAWNEYLLALVLIINPAKQTLQVGIANMVVALNYRADWGALFATMTVAILPVLVIYAFLHKQVVEGMLRGAVKG